jgi:signal peptidase I
MKDRDLRDGELYEYRFRYKSSRSTAWFYCILALIVVAALAFRIYWTNTFGGVLVDGSSMNMTLMNGDELLMKYGSDAQRGDIIVVDVRKYHEQYTFNDNTQFLIKRLIAIEGDSVKCENSQVYLKKAGSEEWEALDEPYAYYSTSYSFSEYTVGDGEIFFLGDNRTGSCDSRYKEHGLSNLNCLYKRTDIYGVVPQWAVDHKDILKKIPVINVGYL